MNEPKDPLSEREVSIPLATMVLLASVGCSNDSEPEKTLVVLRGLEPNYSEYDTDMGAMEWIRQAWEKWENSGYEDDRGLYFSFKLPQGGYILTKQMSQGSVKQDTDGQNS